MTDWHSMKASFDTNRGQDNPPPGPGQWDMCSQTAPSWFFQNGSQMPVGQCDTSAPRPSFLGPMEAVSGPTPWNHTVPLSLPWFQSCSPFPTDVNSDCQFIKRTSPQKRKGDLPEQLPLPSKQYISEEAMSSHLREMHISNNYKPAALDQTVAIGAEDRDIVSPPQSIEELQARLSGDGDLQSKDSLLVLAPELSKLKTEPLLPRSILTQLGKPAMEIVLWKPPGGLVDQLIRSTLEEEHADEKCRRDGHKTGADEHKSPSPLQESSGDSTFDKLFRNYKAVRIPAMMQDEIDNFEEEMNL